MKSHCLITQRVSGNCWNCHVRIEGAHIVNGKDGLARILCHECCPEHGKPERKAVSSEQAEPDLFLERAKA